MLSYKLLLRYLPISRTVEHINYCTSQHKPFCKLNLAAFLQCRFSSHWHY